ncbi:MAG: M48 family metallopeptidase [Kiritimatiellia bacterium]
MLKTGVNFIDGIRVEVVRKRIRRINVRIDATGCVRVSVPVWRATLAEADAFVRAHWKWCVASRAQTLAHPAAVRRAATREALAGLRALLADLTAGWTRRLAEPGVTWQLRRMKTLWGSCQWIRRRVTYNTELAAAPRELVEYVVVHELTHLQVHDHGPRFRALMDARLPGWPLLRRRLNRRDFPEAPGHAEGGEP